MMLVFLPQPHLNTVAKNVQVIDGYKKSYKFIDNTNKYDLLIDKADLSDYKTSDIIVV